jgi:hypothetical protein
MAVTARQLTRATLDRQMLLRREPVGVAEAVRRVVALQAQEPASPYVALWSRVAGFDPSDLDAAFAAATVVKATLMRITLHAVHADDRAALHTAVQPSLRGARLGDRRFTSTGLTSDEADALVPAVLAFAAEPRTNAEVEEWLTAHHGVPAKGVWWALRSYAPLRHAPTGGPWTFGRRPAYLAAAHGIAPSDREVCDTYLQTLVRRYLEGLGPATIADVAQFAMVQRARVKAAVAAMGDSLTRLDGPDGTVLYDVPGAVVPDDDTPAPPRFMAMWDTTLLAYADRSRVVPPEYRRLVTRSNGDVLPTLLVDGQVAGVWRPVDDGVEATAFHRLDRRTWDGLEEEAAALLPLLAEREPRAYRRYDRWWADLPAAEIRVLPA